jgi:hypothetical protein
MRDPLVSDQTIGIYLSNAKWVAEDEMIPELENLKEWP